MGHITPDRQHKPAGWRIEDDRAGAPELAATLDERQEAGGTLAALAPAPAPRRHAAVSWDDSGAGDEIAALDFARRAQVTEAGAGTVERLELAVDELATAYPGTPPGELLGRVRAYLGYVGTLLDGRTTLAEQVVGGWLSLLAATTLINLHRDHAAAAHLRTAAQLAHETGHTEITVDTSRSATSRDSPSAWARVAGWSGNRPLPASTFLFD